MFRIVSLMAQEITVCASIKECLITVFFPLSNGKSDRTLWKMFSDSSDNVDNPLFCKISIFSTIFSNSLADITDSSSDIQTGSLPHIPGLSALSVILSFSECGKIPVRFLKFRLSESLPFLCSITSGPDTVESVCWMHTI